MCCCKRANEQPQTILDRGDWLAKTGQWMMLFGLGLLGNAFINGDHQEWCRAFVVAIISCIAGAIGFSWGMSMRDKAHVILNIKEQS